MTWIARVRIIAPFQIYPFYFDLATLAKRGNVTWRYAERR